MLTKQERNNFKAVIARKGTTMRDWCREKRFNYNSFRTSFRGHQKMVAGSEAEVRKDILSAGMEIDRVAASKDDTEYFAQRRRSRRVGKSSVGHAKSEI